MTRLRMALVLLALGCALGGCAPNRYRSSAGRDSFRPPSGGRDFEEAFWRAVQLDSDAPEMLSLAKDYLKRLGDRAWMFGPRQVKYAERFGIPMARVLDLGGGVTMRMILIPPGEFMMGSRDGYDDERRVHRVLITKPFYLGVCEVTQAQWQAVMGTNPSHFRGADLPVEEVYWSDAQEFIKGLCARKGVPAGTYHLPTEAQWEYACRAGTQTSFHNGSSDLGLGQIAWYMRNSGDRTHLVGHKLPNAFGLYDMSGNVSEWCSDWRGKDYYGKSPHADPPGPGLGSLRVCRGGCWVDEARSCRSAFRNGYSPLPYDGTRTTVRPYRAGRLGFRLVRTSP